MKEIDVYISDDYYKAYLSLRLHGESVGPEEIYEALKKKHVVYGIDDEVISALCELNEDVLDELVAEGQPHIHGIDCEIVYTYEAGVHSHPTILEDGTVDFKSMNLFQKVSSGQVLATKIPATEGIDGMTVTGKSIRAKNGKDKQFSFGENIEPDSEGRVLKATSDGIYKVENGKILVQNYMELDNGVGVETGNINFKGDIVVNGNVCSGYRIDCDGNLTINGLVEGANLISAGDLTITKGVSGHNDCRIECGGNFVVKYIDNAEVCVKGNLEAGEILNSKVFCDGQVIVKGKKGHIIGGEITARYAIDATTIGSRLGVITLINLGVDIDSIKELRSLKEEIAEEQETVRRLKQFIAILNAKEKKEIITDSEVETLKKCYESLEQMTYMIKEKTSRFKHLREILLKAQKGQLKTETIYPDTLVKIGMHSYFIDEAILRSILKKSDDQIVAIGF
ncbi:DUF342 domain-containing protein [Acidaminobacter sp. JC074]|uniref:FapA family protein n=1 Tax=Acidaminobacter sp. JC074 TaxID=2530199 RepID=UPI001F0F5539|nr:FapA family protein [Acidaminobacter sp. JC074]MCH4889045.1 DUF342 domain-containing protein [Acidaminobacter sp. JC074]